MKTFNNQAAQGEVLFTRINELPSTAKLITDPKRFDAGYPIVSHSESGHHHILRGEGVQFFEGADPFVCFLRISSESVLTNMRADQAHEQIGFAPGLYQVNKAREYVSPEETRAVAD